MAWFAEGISPAAHKKLSIRHPSEKSNRRIGGCVATAQSKMTVAPRQDVYKRQAEHRPFNRAELGTLLDLAEKGNKELQAAQRAALSLD